MYSVIKVAIVEDEKLIREGLARLISSAAGFVCVAACRDSEEGLRCIPEASPNVVLMDIDLPGISGIECIRLLKPQLAGAQFMVLTVLEDGEVVFQALKAGATGYLLKSTPQDRMLEAIRDLCNGGSPMSSQIARSVVSYFQKAEEETADASDALTEREREVLRCVAQGLPCKLIADQLGISINTVRKHNKNIYEKLQVRNRVEAINKVFPGRRVSL